MIRRLFHYPIILGLLFAASCANIVAPAGGDKDIIPPKLVSVHPADSQLNVRTGKVRFDFNEYVVLNDAGNQVLISPILPVPPVVTALYKRVTVTFPDSLLQENTTYHISLGNAVRDNHEGNIYKGPDFLFSTGSYFDSLRLGGRVVNAATGLPDTSATVMLYRAADGDSAFARRKPMYAIHADAAGNFAFNGLPGRSFRVFALRDKNGNLVYDDRAEWTAFLGRTIVPGTDTAVLELRTFPAAGNDTALARQNTGSEGGTRFGRRSAGAVTGYAVLTDTTDLKRRTQDITGPLNIEFGQRPTAINKEKIFLSFDSTGVTVEAGLALRLDTARRQLELETPWKENTVYTLRLQKGFAKDSSGNDLLPGRFSFRTKREEDYAKLKIHLPTKYYGNGYVLQVNNDLDTIYQMAITDSTVLLPRLTPGSYRLRIIEDKNHNGHWDTGDLFGGVQPERIIPYDQVVMLKPGWENELDFERNAQPAGKSSSKSPTGALK